MPFRQRNRLADPLDHEGPGGSRIPALTTPHRGMKIAGSGSGASRRRPAVAIDEDATMAERTVRENPGPGGEAREFPGCRGKLQLYALLRSRGESDFRARLQALRRRSG